MTIVIPGNPYLSQFWTDVVDPSVSIPLLWEKYPYAMMSAAPTVYSIRGNPTSVANPSSSAITPEHATEIITYALAHSYTETALKYPVEVLEYGSDLVAMVEGELDHSPSQIERFREMVSLLRRGHTLTNLLDSYPDIVLNGAYDLIHLDKWLKQGIFPN